MRSIVMALAAASLCSSTAFAQGAPAQTGPQNPAIRTTDQNNSASPVAGANSFTQKEAMSRIEAKGYDHVTQLKKDANGVWRGMAQKNGASVAVSVDYQGNVN